MSLPGSLQELVEQLKQLPGVGAKSAQRLAFHILRTPREDTDRLCQAIRDVKDRFLAELKSGKSTFYNLVVASAFRIDATAAGVVFTFLPNQKNAKSQCDEQKAWLQSIAEKVSGRPVPVSIVVADSSASAPAPEKPAELRRDPASPAFGREGGEARASPEELKAEAMANSTVQAVLEIFPVDKTTIEER